MKLKTFSLWLAGCIVLIAEREPLVTNEISERITENLRKLYLPFSKDPASPEGEAIRIAALGELNDREKIRGLVEWMFSYPTPGHASIPTEGTRLLISPKREIQDLSELRRLMNAETDSNRFYILSKFSLFFESRYGESFMAERSRGLLMRGTAAKFGQGQSPYRLNDISFYAYDTILEDLKLRNSPFITEVLPTLTGKPESQKVLALARWLKNNWPGCEGLEILANEGGRPDLKTGVLTPPAERLRPPENLFFQQKEQNFFKILAISIVIFVVILAIVFFVLRRFARQ